MRGLAVVSVIALGAGACKDEAKERAAAPRTGGEDAGAMAPSTANAKPKPKRPLVPRAEVEALFERWLASQNTGDFDTYAALYGDGFRGVRRTGKETVRLDRAGWLRERRRMFRRPMKVSAAAREIAVGTDRAEIRITQDWASGTYRDVGPKLIEIAKTPGGLRIVREEMLSSTLVEAPAEMPVSSARFALVYEGNVVLGAPPPVVKGPAVLTEGTFPEPEPECDGAAPDYETEHELYWTCYAAEPDNHTDDYAARRPVEAAEAGARASWIGKKLTLYGASGVACQASVVALAGHGEWRARASDVGEEATAADAVLASGNPVLVGALDGACPGAAFARDAALPAPPRWNVTAAGPKVVEAAEAMLADVVEAEGHAEWAVPPEKTFLEISPPAGATGRWVAALLEGAEDCHEDTFVAVLWRWAEDATDRALVFEYRDRAFAIRAAADLTGDGVPEIVLDDGLLLWDAEYEELDRLALVDFTEEVIDACHCECE